MTNDAIEYDRMEQRIHAILDAPPIGTSTGTEIGRSREGRPISAFHFGTGQQCVSLLGGCHADEPVGPRLLKHLCRYLSDLPESDRMLSRYQWWIVPHINPDGAEVNRVWQQDDLDAYSLADYLLHRARELPGDDIEFCFPRCSSDEGVRPENRAVYDWWRTADGPFVLHVSLHGMGFAAGPWFLIDAAWKNRCGELKQKCARRVGELGYSMHDVQRNGDKGFFRLGRGFCTRPDSRYMRQHFIDAADHDTAALFRPSSMETIRSFGGDPLTLVSEMPLFLTPGVGEVLGPPDPVAQEWKERIEGWTARLKAGVSDTTPISDLIFVEAQKLDLRAMPIRDQMELQWTLVVAGLEQVASSG